MIFGRIKAYAIAFLGILTAVLGAIALKYRGDKFKQQATVEKAKAETLTKANQASHEAGEKARKDTEDALQKASRGDFSSLDNHW